MLCVCVIYRVRVLLPLCPCLTLIPSTRNHSTQAGSLPEATPRGWHHPVFSAGLRATPVRNQRRCFLSYCPSCPLLFFWWLFVSSTFVLRKSPPLGMGVVCPLPHPSPPPSPRLNAIMKTSQEYSQENYPLFAGIKTKRVWFGSSYNEKEEGEKVQKRKRFTQPTHRHQPPMCDQHYTIVAAPKGLLALHTTTTSDSVGPRRRNTNKISVQFKKICLRR